MTPAPDADNAGRGLAVVVAAALVLVMVLVGTREVKYSARGSDKPGSATLAVGSHFTRSAREGAVRARRAPLRAVARVKAHTPKRAAAHARAAAGVLSAIERSPAAIAPRVQTVAATGSPAAQPAPKRLISPAPQSPPPSAPMPSAPKVPAKTSPKPQADVPLAFDEQGPTPRSNDGVVQFDNSGAGSGPTP